jgi:hypothetical protein
MKTKVDLKNEVKFTPVFMQDEQSHYYEVYYKGFRQVIGMGKTKEEAELNLLQIFIVKLKESKEKIREQSLNRHYSD